MRFRVGAILVALTLVAAPTFAQSVTGAVKVGVNFSKVSGTEDGVDYKTDWKPGLAIGAGVDVPITDLFSFAPEVLYSMKGGKNGDFTGDGGEDVKLKIDVVQIPLLFKANFAGGSARPFVVFGPGIGFVTKAKFEAGSEEEDIKDDVEKVDFSAIIGAGVQFGRGTIEARYDHGFRDLDKDSSSEAKMKTFSVLFGVRFGG